MYGHTGLPVGLWMFTWSRKCLTRNRDQWKERIEGAKILRKFDMDSNRVRGLIQDTEDSNLIDTDVCVTPSVHTTRGA